jgi:tetratricopeptide (TPR) repeat protein
MSPTIFAHGDLSARINSKTSQISKTPNNAVLYYDRGFLYQQHEEYSKALKDFNKAKNLGYNNKLLYYRFAETYKIIGEYDRAMFAISNYLKFDANDIKIHKLKAQILIKQKKHNEALVAYDYVLKNTIDLRPDDIIEYCNIILAIDPNNFSGALETLEFGLKKTGANSFVLLDKKIEYLSSLGETEEVLKQYNYFIETSERRENWYYKKAFYLNKIDRNQEATIALQQAKMSIQLLNTRFQQTPNIKLLTKKINELEKTL